MTPHRAENSLARNEGACHYDNLANGGTTIFSAARWCLSFLWHWLRFAIQGAGAGAFGFAAIPGGAVVTGAMGYLGMTQGQQWYQVMAYAFEGAGAAWFIGFFYHLICFAPRKAYVRLEPLYATITDSWSPPDLISNEKLRGYAACVIVKNKSSEYLLDCSIKVTDTKDHDDGAHKKYPRFIDKIDLPPYSEKRVVIAYWFSRQPPNADDSTIQIIGPVAPVFGGNILRISASAEYLMLIDIQSDAGPSKQILCRLWVDSQARKLKATLA